MKKAPYQTEVKHGVGHSGRISWNMHMRAYEVYCEVYSPQEALTKGECRGGFGTHELMALLYARSFPKNEWETRFDEAYEGFRKEPEDG